MASVKETIQSIISEWNRITGKDTLKPNESTIEDLHDDMKKAKPLSEMQATLQSSLDNKLDAFQKTMESRFEELKATSADAGKGDEKEKGKDDAGKGDEKTADADTAATIQSLMDTQKEMMKTNEAVVAKLADLLATGKTSSSGKQLPGTGKKMSEDFTTTARHKSERPVLLEE